MSQFASRFAFPFIAGCISGAISRVISSLAGPRGIVAAAALAAAAFAPAALAQTSISVTDSGWHSEAGFHDDSVTTYRAGETTDRGELRGWLVFDLTGVTDTVTAVDLTVNSYTILDGPNTIGFYEVSSGVATLRAASSNGGPGAAIWTDLGDGTSYGTFSFSTDNTFETISLNASAVAAVNAARGGYFAIGLTNLTNGAADDGVFSLSGLNAGNVLTLTTDDPGEIGVEGNGLAIADGDASPQTADGTDFGAVGVASATATSTFTIANTGAGPLNIASVVISGANAGDFSVTASPASSVAAGGSTSVDVTFDPSAAGLRTAAVTINSDDLDESVYDFAIQGTGDATAAEVVSVERQTPATSPTNADSLTFRVTFSEGVVNVDATDFEASGTTATASGVAAQSGTVYDVTISGGDLAGLDGSVGLGFASGQDIEDAAGNPLTDTTPSGANETYVLDNTAPTATLSSAASDPTTGVFTLNVAFSESVAGLADGDFTVTNGAAGSLSGSGDTYAVEITPAGDGTVTVELPAGSADDSAGNGNAVSNLFSIDADLTAPTVLSIARQNPTASPTNADSLTFRVSFSEDVANVDDADFSPTGTTATASVATVSSSVYDVTLSGGDLAALDGTVGLGFAGGQDIVDLPGNALADTTPASEETYLVDNAAPALSPVTIASDNADPSLAMIGDTITVSFTANEPLASPTATVAGRTASIVDNGGNSYSASITVTGADAQGSVGFAVTAPDAAGNTGGAAATTDASAVAIDSVAPTAALSSLAADPTSGQFILDIAFSEVVTGLASADFDISNGTAGALASTGSGDTYTLEVTPTADGTVTVSLPADSAQDGAGNGNGVSNLFSIEADLSAPTVTLSSTDPDPTNADVTIAVDFSEVVDGLAAGDFTLTNASTVSLSPVGPADSYTLVISPDADGTVSVELPADSALDGAGNGNTLSNLFSFEADLTAPTVLSVERAPAATSPTNADALTFRVTFSEGVSGVDASDFAPTGTTATATGVAPASSSVYDVTVSGGDLASLEGVVGLGFAGGQDIADLVGNDLVSTSPAGADETYQVDNTAPTVALTLSAADTDPTPGVFTLDVAFSESVDGLLATNFVVSNGSAGGLSGSGDAYTVEITPAGSGTVTVELPADSAADSAGNLNSVSNLFSIEADLAKPTVTLSSAAADPTSGAFTLDVAFSETVTGLEASDFVLTNASAGAPSGAGASYTVEITPAGDGTVTVELPADSAFDGASNGNSAAVPFTIENDETAPSLSPVTIASDNADPSLASAGHVITVSFTSSEPLVSPTATIAGRAAGVVDNGGNSYSASITVTGADAQGPVGFSVTAPDAAGNVGGAGATTDASSVAIDQAAPTVILSSTDPDPTNADVTISVDFSETVDGLTAGDFVLANASVVSLSPAGPADSFTLVVSPNADGAATVELPAGGATDGANVNAPSNVFSITYDASAPTVALSTAATGPVTAAFNLDIAFSEDVTGLSLADLVVANATASNLSGAGANYAVIITPAGAGAITVDLPVAGAQDAAGNDSLAAAQFTIQSDAVAPGLASLAGSPDPITDGDAGPGGFTLTAVFSEAMDTSVNPTIGFPSEDPGATLTAASGAWTSATTYVATYDVTDAQQVIAGVDVAVSGARDAVGNVMAASTTADVFSIDMPGGGIVLEVASIGGDGAFDFASSLAAFDGAVATSGGAAALSASNIPPGAYDIAQIAGPGFELTDLSCVDPDGGSAVSLANGAATVDLDNLETVTCTFTNTVQGQVSVAVNTLGQDGAFDFSGGLGAFTVTTSANAGAASFSDLDSGAYDIVFAGLEGFKLTGLSCTGDADASTDLASGAASIDLDAGEAVSCAFEATADPQLSVPSGAAIALTLPFDFDDVTTISTTVPLTNIGGAPADFSAAVDEPWFSVTPTSGVLEPGETIDLVVAFTEEAAALEPGRHAGMLTIVNESAGAGTTAGGGSGSPISRGALTFQVAATIDPREGTLTLAASTGPQPAAGDASFAYASPTPELRMSLTTANGHAASGGLDMVYGTYVLSQTAPEGWRLDAIACEGDADGGSVIDLAAQQVTVDLDPEEKIVCTFSNVMDEAYVIAQTQTVISSFMALRADRILEASPDLGDRMRSRGAGSAGFSADATEGRRTASLSYSLADLRNAQTDERWAAADGVEAGSLGRTGDWRDGVDVWLQASYTNVHDDRADLGEDADFGAVFVGADYLFKDNLLAGAIAQFDWTSTEGGTLGSSASGAGWLFGPYLAASLGENLYADIRGAWGRSNNEVRPFGTYEDSFDTTRYLIEANLSGDIDFGGYRLSPDAGLAYFDETQKAYTDSLNIRIPEQTLEILRLRAGGELAYRFERADGGYYEPYVSLRGIYDFDPASVPTGAGRVSFGDVRASAGAGISARYANGSTFEAAVSFDGVGAGDYGAATGRIQFSIPFGAGAGRTGGAGRSDAALAGGWDGLFGEDDYSFGPYGLEQRGGLSGFR